jgi:predicted DNA-binding transcriptional regulator AlpA
MPKQRLIPPHERLGLARAEAAEYIGVSPSLFDEMVADGRMPKPKVLNARKVWHRLSLDKAFAELPEEGQKEDPANPRRDFA